MPLILNYGVTLQILWTILLLLSKYDFGEDQDILRHAFELIERESPEGGALNSADRKFSTASSIKSEADRLARFLCQSIEYCHRADMGTLGPQSTTYTQWVLRCYYRKAGLDRELEWCRNIKYMTGPNSQCGIVSMLFGEDADDI